MKKIVSLLLVFIVCISSFPLLAFTKNGSREYTDTETETIYSRYTYYESMLDEIFADDTNVGYWSMVNETEENGFLKWLIDASSWIIGEYPDKKKYADILANLVMMQSGDLAEQVQNQSRYDDLKDGMDYAMDIVGIASDFVGGANLLEEISPIIDAATDGAEVIIDNVEQAKYYETTIRDYAQSRLFLDAISNYAENEDLRTTASTLLEANDKLLESRLEYLADSSATLVDYQAKFFVKNMSFELLKNADLYKTDETVKWYVDSGKKITDSIQLIFSKAKFAFRMTMLAGDIGFGTSDTFNRYQEMKTVSEIASAIIEANHHVKTPSRYDSPDALSIIQTKCEYYKMLIATHARGEYLVYQLLINDAKLLSDFRALFDTFKDPRETTESWYNGQIEVMFEYFDILNNMLVTDDENEIRQDSERGNSIGNISNGGLVAQSGDWIYYQHTNDGFKLYKMRADGSEKTKLNDNISYCINVVEDWIYYINNSDIDAPQCIYKMRTDGSENTKLNDSMSEDINVIGDWIYYKKYCGNGDWKLHKLAVDGSQEIMLYDRAISDFCVTNDWIYFTDYEDGWDYSLCKIRTDGSGKTKLINRNAYDINIEGDWIYYTIGGLEDKVIRKIRTDGKDETKVNRDGSFYMNVIGGWIYYSNWNDGNKLYKIRTDGSQNTKLTDDECVNIHIIDEWIYYTIDFGNGELYRIRKEGTDRQIIAQ